MFHPEKDTYQTGRTFLGGGFTVATPVPDAPSIGSRRGPINDWTNEVGNGAVIALDPHIRKPKWKVTQFDVSDSGMLTTASDLLFTGKIRRRSDSQSDIGHQPTTPVSRLLTVTRVSPQSAIDLDEGSKLARACADELRLGVEQTRVAVQAFEIAAPR